MVEEEGTGSVCLLQLFLLVRILLQHCTVSHHGEVTQGALGSCWPLLSNFPLLGIDWFHIIL